jgi:hypothetical protein
MAYVMLLGLEAGGAANGDAASPSLLAPSWEALRQCFLDRLRSMQEKGNMPDSRFV